MKRFVPGAALQVKKSGRLGALQIVAGFLSANAAGAALSHFQALAHIAADAASDCIGGQILQLITALAAPSGGLDFNSITGQVAGGATGALLTIIVGTIGNFLPRERSVGAHSALAVDHISEQA